MAQAAYPARQVSILVSDVPDATPDALASGPTMPDSTTVEDCQRIVAKYRLLEAFPVIGERAVSQTRDRRDPQVGRPCIRPFAMVARAIEQGCGRRSRSCRHVPRIRRRNRQLVRRLGLRTRRRLSARPVARTAKQCLARLSNLRRGSDREGVEWRHGRSQPAIRAGLRPEDCRRRYCGTERGYRWRRRKQSKRQGRSSTAAHSSAQAARGWSVEDSLSKFDAYPLIERSRRCDRHWAQPATICVT